MVTGCCSFAAIGGLVDIVRSIITNAIQPANEKSPCVVQGDLMSPYRKPNSVGRLAATGTIIYLGRMSPCDSSGSSAHRTDAMTDAALHRSKDFAVAPPCRQGAHQPRLSMRLMPLPFGSGVSVRTSGHYPGGRYPLPLCFMTAIACAAPQSRCSDFPHPLAGTRSSGTARNNIPILR
jgi:hypothetical protein